METLPDFVRVRLRQLAYDKPPPSTLLTVLRELAREYKVSLSGDAAKIGHQKMWCSINGFRGRWRPFQRASSKKCIVG
jgi:hypothetical protein